MSGNGNARWLYGLAALLIVVAGWAAWHYSQAPGVQLPEVDFTGIDPAIQKAVWDAKAKVLQEPNSSQAWGRLGMVLITHDFRAPAKICLERAEQLDPQEVRWPYFQALGTIVFGEGELALPKLERAAALAGSEFDGPRWRLAELFSSLERLDEAERHFRLVLKDWPNHMRARLGLARILARRGENQQAIDQLGDCQTDLTTRKAALTLLAEIQQRQGNEAAAEETRRRIQTLPKDLEWPDVLNWEVIDVRQGKHAALQWASVLSRNGRGAQAIEVLRKAVDDYPDADEAWQQLGTVLLKYKHPQMAVHALRRATELAPKSHEAQFYLGTALIVTGDRPGAKRCFRAAIEQKPDYAPAHHNLGAALAEEGQIDEAIAEFRSAIRFDPTQAESHAILARHLAAKKNNAEALYHALAAERLRPGDVANRTVAARAGRALHRQFGLP